MIDIVTMLAALFFFLFGFVCGSLYGFGKGVESERRKRMARWTNLR